MLRLMRRRKEARVGVSVEAMCIVCAASSEVFVSEEEGSEEGRKKVWPLAEK